MESRIFVLLLSAWPLAMLLLASPAQAEPALDSRPAVIEAGVNRREISPSAIDAENFEVGLFAGQISIEDFGSDVLTGLQMSYHISEGFFVEGVYGRARAGTTSYERLSGAVELLTDDERDYSYYNLSLGFNILPGEGFIGSRRAFNTALYLIAGAGSTEFAGDNRFTISFGAGYRFLATDWLALHLDVRDHLFEIDLLGENKTTHNLELHAGLTVFF